MTLPASGAIDAAAINVELGRASTAAFDINGSAERTLAGIPSGAISFSSFYGKSSVITLDTQTVTIGGIGSPAGVDRTRGYVRSSFGSISSGNSGLYGGAQIYELYWAETSDRVFFKVVGALSNSGWTSMTVGSTTFNRTSAVFSISGGYTTWSWGPVGGIGSQPFGAGGATRTVTWQ